MRATDANSNLSEIQTTSISCIQDDSAKMDINEEARDCLRELRHANAKYAALVNMSLEDIEEAAHDR